MELKFICKICNKPCGKTGLTNHIQRTHKMSYKEYYDTYIDGSEHRCPYCGKECGFVSHYGYYETCCNPTCVRKAQHRTMYARYGKACRHLDKIKAKPIIDYPYHCEICGQGTKNLPMLNRHLKKYHPDVDIEKYYNTYLGVKPQVCEVCGNRAKWLGTHYHNVCGCPECTSVLRGKNNAMNNPVYRKKARDALIALPEEKKRAIREKAEQTCLARFGYRHNWSSPELREAGQYATCKTLYGDRNYHNVAQMQNTCTERFGVRSFSQTASFQSKMWHKFKVGEITFDSSYEYALYNFLNAVKLPFIYHPKESIRYEYAGKEHLFFPDFKINGHFYEIKGEHLYKNMQTPNTKEHAKLECILANNITLITKCDIFAFIDAIFGKSLSIDAIVEKCLHTEFPGNAKWPASHPIWDCFVPGHIDPRSAWADPGLVRRGVLNLVKTLNDALVSGKYPAFCARYIKSLLSGNYFDKVLDRFTIAKIAPKVTALHENELLRIIEESGVDLSPGVYCPMAGFGGIVRGARRWFETRGMRGDIEAYDINDRFCNWYGWTRRDVLAQVVHTNKVVVVCPPFGKQYEHWKGTPDEMSDITFKQWVSLIKEHVIAPNYIFIGPEVDGGKNRCGLFKRKVGISLYKDGT